jgi:serine/threonine protein phosphatase PrpC
VQTTTTIASARASSSVVVSASSDTGMVRAVNEDSYLAAGPIFLVADGMGGHNAGDQASQAVRTTFGEAFPDDVPATTAGVLAAIKSSNNAVRAISGDDGVGRAMSGTTLAGVALVTSGDSGLLHWMAFNIGDSRIYSWDGRSLAQLSVDHSAVQELVEAGVITDEEAVLHPDRNVITRAIGASEHVDADVWLLPANRRQSFLMCSDGLTKELGDEQIARILAEHPDDPAGPSLAQVLVEAALAAGGRDNVTVVVVESITTGSDVDGDNDETVDRVSLEVFEDTRPRS